MPTTEADAGWILGEHTAPDPVRPTTPAAGPARRYIFQSSPTVQFAPPESSDGRTRITFDRVGEVKIWAQVEWQEGEEMHRRETRVITCSVTPPEFTLTLSPESPEVGDEVRARIPLSRIISWPTFGAAQLLGPAIIMPPMRRLSAWCQKAPAPSRSSL